jgi:hypothetical protein
LQPLAAYPKLIRRNLQLAGKLAAIAGISKKTRIASSLQHINLGTERTRTLHVAKLSCYNNFMILGKKAIALNCGRP